MPFYLKVNGQKHRESAHNVGFTGDDWRERILEDLLNDEQLEILQREDDKGPLLELYGRLYRALAVPDKFRSDTLFVIGLFDGPARGQRIPQGTVRVPGPWKVLPSWAGDEQSTFPVREHVDAFVRKHPFWRGGVATPKVSRKKAPPRFNTMAEALQGFSIKPAPKDTAPSGRLDQPGLQAADGGVDAPLAQASTDSVGVTTTVTTPADRPGPPSPHEEPDRPPEASTQTQAQLASDDVAPASPATTGTLADSDSDGPPKDDLQAHASPALDEVAAEPASPEPPATPLSEMAPATDLDSDIHQLLLKRLPPGIQPLVAAEQPALALKARRHQIREEIADLKEQLETLPSLKDLASQASRVADVMERLQRLGVAVAPDSESAPGLDLTFSLLEAMESDSWTGLPEWIGLRGERRERLINDAEAAAEVEEVLAWASGQFGDALPGELATLEPGGGDRLLEQVRNAWRQHELKAGLQDRLSPLPVLPMLKSLDADQVEEVLERVEALLHCLHPDALDSLWDRFPGDGIENWLSESDPRRFQLLPDGVVGSMHDWSAVDTLLDHLAETQAGDRGEASAAEVPEAPSTFTFKGFAHPITDESGKIHAAAVAVKLPPPGSDLGTFNLAVRVRAETPFTGEATLYARTRHLRAMPGQPVAEEVELVEDPEEPSVRCLRQLLQVSQEQWDRGRSDTWYLDLTVPMVGYRVFLERLLAKRPELNVTCTIVVGEVSGKGSLTYNRFLDDVPAVSIPQEDNTDLEFMQAAPLGVQLGYENLEPYVRRATKSFFVSAPRRFGKTTLLRHLESVALENPDSAVFRITLNRNESPRTSMENVLEHIRDEVHERFRMRVEMPLRSDGLPDRHTFRELRQRLAQRGLHNLVLMVDEAQSLVPRSDGGTWGNNLKDLIEGDLAECHPKELTRVCIVLVGTPQLPRRLGPNCQAFMNVMAERTAFRESELAVFIRNLSAGQMESTAPSRERLARTANNLYTLKMLLREVVSLLQEDGRAFFLSRDVDRASEQLIRRDREGEIGLWDYVAAELSHTDDWDPVDAYPVALALTMQQGAEPADDEPTSSVLEWLDECLRECKIQATVIVDRVEDGIEELIRLGIIDQDRQFKRPLLKTLLRRRAQRSPFQHNLDQIALARLAVDVINWDGRATPRSEGGQAQVFVLETDQGPQAWRLCTLDSENERRRFVRTCAAIKVLRDTRTRLQGDANLPRVRAAGFDLNDPKRGIMVYDWIEGEAFSDIWEVASPLTRAHVVTQVAQALDALQARGFPAAPRAVQSL